MSWTLSFIIAIWELPQNIMGLIFWLFLMKKINQIERKNGRFFFQVQNFGISLGLFVFWSGTDEGIIPVKITNKQHEFGHAIQSLIFGPLYLLVIGIPSVSRCIYGYGYYFFRKQRWQYYYSGYPENWADCLGEKYFQRKK